VSDAGEPMLTSLCVHAGGTVGDGFASAARTVRGGSTGRRRRLYGGEHLKCYRALASDLPSDGWAGDPDAAVVARCRLLEAAAKGQKLCFPAQISYISTNIWRVRRLPTACAEASRSVSRPATHRPVRRPSLQRLDGIPGERPPNPTAASTRAGSRSLPRGARRPKPPPVDAGHPTPGRGSTSRGTRRASTISREQWATGRQVRNFADRVTPA
jgi:hypothetical protein